MVPSAKITKELRESSKESLREKNICCAEKREK